MIRIWLTFIVLAVVIHIGIGAWRALTGREKLDLTKSAIYSIVVASLAALAMTLIYNIF